MRIKELKPKKSKIDFVSFKVNLVKIGFFIFVLALFWRLYNLQIVRGEYFRDISLKQGVGSAAPKPERGNIYFEDKNGKLVPAAVNKNGFTLAINPKIIENEEKLYEKLSEITEIDRDDFFAKVSKKNDPYEILAPRIDKDMSYKVKLLQKDFKGLILSRDSWRFYPANNFASHALGFVGYENDVLQGRYGVENYYDEYLEGRIKKKSKFNFGSLLDFGENVFQNYESEGSSLVLTIEPILQGVLESNLEKILKEYNGIKAGGIIINPQNGKILAIAAKPDFNPNNYKNIKDISVFNNPVVSSVYEVGSIFKPLTMAAALDQNAVTSETKYYDKGFIVLNGRRIENYDGKARGEVDMQTVLNKSLNTGAVFAMQSLGKEKFKDYILKYNLNVKTGIDLPNEVSGKIDNLNSKRDIEFATASFGQGIAVSPLEFAVAASSLANGGNTITPRIADRIILGKNAEELQNDKNNNIIKIEGKIIPGPIKKETSEKISRMLTSVVDDALLEGSVKLDYYSIAAKTGTAQLIKGNEKGYSEEYLHTFFGYAPSFDSKFLVVLFLEKPQGVKYASHSLTPAFMDIMKFMLNYYEIPPDR